MSMLLHKAAIGLFDIALPISRIHKQIMDEMERYEDSTDELNTRGLVLHQPQRSAQQQPWRNPVPSEPFPFLDLPAEIQRLVFEHYFGKWSVIMDHERYNMFRTKFKVYGVAPTDLLLTCRAFYRIGNAIRIQNFTGRLTLNSVFLLITLRKKEELSWLRSNVRILHFSDSSVNPERWSTYFTGFDRLQHLEIDNPSIIRLGPDCLDLEEILTDGGGGGSDGRHREPLIANMDKFRTGLIHALQGILSVTVEQRYCLRDHLMATGWSGILHAKVVLSRSDIEVVDLRYDANASVISKREFARPREL